LFTCEFQITALKNLTLLIRLTRIAEPPDYALEEQLYHLLMDIYRSSSALVLWSSLPQSRKLD
jgi:hypothetical protein